MSALDLNARRASASERSGDWAAISGSIRRHKRTRWRSVIIIKNECE